MLTYRMRHPHFIACLASWVVALCCCMVLGLKITASVEDLKRKIIIDTDAGADDGMAILLLLYKPKNIQVIAITTITGNTGSYNVSKNVLKVLDTAGRLDIPVYLGSEENIMGDWSPSYYYGTDGFGDFTYQQPLNESLIRKENSAVFLANTIRENPGEITLLSIGPLTNLAIAAHLYSRFFVDLKEIIILGGSYQGGGNLRPGVEFNIGTDPEAASFVFSKIPPSLVTLIPIETLMKNSFSMEWRKEVLGNLKSKSMDLINKAERTSLKGQEWVCFDPTAAAVILDASFVKSTVNSLPLIEVQGVVAKGAMLQNFDRNTVTIVTDVDKSKLMSLLLSHLS